MKPMHSQNFCSVIKAATTESQTKILILFASNVFPSLWSAAEFSQSFTTPEVKRPIVCHACIFYRIFIRKCSLMQFHSAHSHE